MMRLFALPAVFAACMTVASAQTIVVKPSEPRATGPIVAEQVRISVAVNLFIAAPADESEAAIKAQEDGRRLVYDVAARECSLLRDVLASDCRLELGERQRPARERRPEFQPAAKRRLQHQRQRHVPDHSEVTPRLSRR